MRPCGLIAGPGRALAGQYAHEGAMGSKYTRKLQDIMLSWDWWELGRELDEGRGPIPELPTIPSDFQSADVS